MIARRTYKLPFALDAEIEKLAKAEGITKVAFIQKLVSQKLELETEKKKFQEMQKQYFELMKNAGSEAKSGGNREELLEKIWLVSQVILLSKKYNYQTAEGFFENELRKAGLLK